MKFNVTVASAFAIAAIPSSVQAAQYIANTNAASGTLQTSGPTDVVNRNGLAPVASSASSLTDSSATQAARAFSSTTARAETGAVHASSTARADTFATACCTSALAGASAYAEFNDSFVVRSAGLANGTLATLTGTVLLNGSTPSAFSGQFWGANAFWRATQVTGGTINTYGYSFSGNASNCCFTTGSNTFGLFTFSADVFVGQATNFVLRLETSVQANAGGFGVNSAEQSANLGNTFSWQGIQSLTAGGRTITDFTATSASSGFDYRRGLASDNAVPEPATWALMMLGFGAIGGAMRSRPRVVVRYA